MYNVYIINLNIFTIFKSKNMSTKILYKPIENNRSAWRMGDIENNNYIYSNFVSSRSPPVERCQTHLSRKQTQMN